MGRKRARGGRAALADRARTCINGQDRAISRSMTDRPLLVLVAGPYRSGTGDDPDRLAANVEHMNRVALDVFRAGHTPVTGEALALPLVELAGSGRGGDEVFDTIFHPIALRLLDRCDAVVRTGGPSEGADLMALQARAAGKLVVTDPAALPVAVGA